MCIDIDTINDARLEDNEQFSIEISSNDRVDIGVHFSTITILDDDSKIDVATKVTILYKFFYMLQASQLTLIK